MTSKTYKNNLIIFAKSPVPGTCKTRLAPLLGEEGACSFYIDLLEHCLYQSSQVAEVSISIYASPDTQHPLIQQLAEKYNASLKPQTGKDLGERMYNAMANSLQSYDRCVLIGSDIPAINSQYITQAFQSLQVNEVALGPASDGGYVLIGACNITPSVFANTQWSTSHVFHQCISNLTKHRVQYETLPELWDIDTPSDFIDNLGNIELLLNKKYLVTSSTQEQP